MSTVRSRATWVIADQVTSSIANASANILIARAVAPTEFGAFAVAFSIYSLTLSAAQALGSQVFAILYSDRIKSEQVLGARAAAGAALGVGIIAGLACGAIAMLLSDPLQRTLLLTAVALPGLALQDAWRGLLVAQGRPGAAFVNDVVVLASQTGGLLVCGALGLRSVTAYVIVWGAAAWIAAIIGIAQTSARPSLRLSLPFVVTHREVSGPALSNSFATLGTSQIAFFVIATAGTLSDLGALRAAQTLLGPLTILGLSATTFVIPEVVKRRPPFATLMRIAFALSGVLIAADLAWGAVLLFLPRQVGQALLGQTWQAAQTTIVPMVAFVVLIAVTTGPNAIMRSLNRTASTLWTNALFGPLLIALSWIGVVLAGATGAAVGFALAAAIVAPVPWYFGVRTAKLGARAARSLGEAA